VQVAQENGRADRKAHAPAKTFGVTWEQALRGLPYTVKVIGYCFCCGMIFDDVAMDIT
jgi:hypothetical protein